MMPFDHLSRLSKPLPSARRPLRTRNEEDARERRQQIAEETLRYINNGFYFTMDGIKYAFTETQSYGQMNTLWVGPNDLEIQEWRSPTHPITFPVDPPVPATLSVVMASTVKTIHDLCAEGRQRIGVLNCASPIMPGRGFTSGLEGQEESLARSSNLHAMLTSDEGTRFYEHHMSIKTEGFNSHAMIFAPVVLFMRDETGRTVSPCQVSVLSCAAVNRVDVHRHFKDNLELFKEMEDQMYGPHPAPVRGVP
ncbi:hypothetical protein DL93DRAFT_2156771 [Clavulina sp. PMI_390]|nr:hypothetical protein DL93DRAFT_2156771 [Clavulina sp. PMI_390]